MIVSPGPAQPKRRPVASVLSNAMRWCSREKTGSSRDLLGPWLSSGATVHEVLKCPAFLAPCLERE